MKIGILTFHSQLNYGGVLQSWALQTALEKLGHKVVIIDRWLDSGNSRLERGFNLFGFRQWLRFGFRVACGLGDWARLLRVHRTKRFIRQYLNLSPYHFVEWKDAPPNLGVDLLVVGSDQVWHCGDFGDPRVYLLENAPYVPAIAYAASFGMTELPVSLGVGAGDAEDMEAAPVYRRGLSRFKAVSCREAEGVRLCAKYGVHAEHVADPTLLLPVEGWGPIMRRPWDGKRKRCSLFCYFLSEGINDAWPLLESFAEENGCGVKVFMDYGNDSLLPLPISYAKLKTWAQGVARRAFGDVFDCVSAGPLEFVRAISEATWVVSDSFHALMFATVFKKNVRILRPKTEFRRKMFARIEEFAEHANGPLVSKDLSEALASLRRDEPVAVDATWLEERRVRSMKFLLEEVR